VPVCECVSPCVCVVFVMCGSVRVFFFNSVFYGRQIVSIFKVINRFTPPSLQKN
jgi:hypothetical protein